MLEFLEAFERRSWRCAAEMPFLAPISREDLRESSFAALRPTRD